MKLIIISKLPLDRVSSSVLSPSCLSRCAPVAELSCRCRPVSRAPDLCRRCRLPPGGRWLFLWAKNQNNVYLVKCKGFFFIYCSFRPLDRSNHFELSPWRTCSFRHQLGFSGKNSSHAAITREDYSLTFQPPSLARHSFIQLSGWLRRKWKCTCFETVAKIGFSIDCKSGFLPLSYL